MTKNYYRSEYSDKQWKALIDKATELGCQITYSKYGNIVTIDSTDRESLIIAQTGRGGQDRVVLAERINLTRMPKDERNKFKRTGVLHNGAECIEIQIDEYAARMNVK